MNLGTIDLIRRSIPRTHHNVRCYTVHVLILGLLANLQSAQQINYFRI
jgi:hypothetical protein